MYNLQTATDKEILGLIIKESVDTQVIDALLLDRSIPDVITDMTYEEMTAIKGIGQSKAKQLLAVQELFRRMASGLYATKKVAIKSPKDVADYAMVSMRYLKVEEFRVLLLDTKNQIIKMDTISIGTINASIVHPREIFRSAIKASAASIVLLHQHPSGNPKPSKEDIHITKRLVETSEVIGIKVIDHVIIGDGDYYSMKENDLM